VDRKTYKDLLLLLVLLVLLVNYNNLYKSDVERQLSELKRLQTLIASQKSFALYYQKSFPKERIRVEKYINYFYDENDSVSQAMGRLHALVTSGAKKGCAVIDIKWLDPQKEATFVRLPMDIDMECNSTGVVNFLDTLKKNDKFILINRLFLRSKPDRGLVRVKMGLMGYKIEKGNLH
jgi:hypothetical protein